MCIEIFGNFFMTIQQNYIIVTFCELACSRKLKQDKPKSSNANSRNYEEHSTLTH